MPDPDNRPDSAADSSTDTLLGPREARSSAAPKPAAPLIGTQLGKYLLRAKLGEGGMGVVYEAEDVESKQLVALKLLPRPVASNPLAIRRFETEAKSASRLKHPNIVTICEVGQHEDLCFLVMELVEGANANEYLKEHGRYPWEEATRLIAQVCRGLSAAHDAGLIHRDIKPSNIMRGRDGVVKLTDFGLAKITTEASAQTQSGSVMGTPHFMSPEQCRAERLDRRTDIYSLGATYYTLLTGYPPYVADNPYSILFAHCSAAVPDPRARVSNLPAGCAGVILRAMAKDPAKRYATADEMLADLKLLLPDAQKEMQTPPTDATIKHLPEAPTVVLGPIVPPPAQRSRHVEWLALAVIVVLGLLVALLFYFHGARAHLAKEWDGLQASANTVMNRKDVPGLEQMVAQVTAFQKANESTSDSKRREIVASAEALAARLQKGIAFQKSITSNGLPIVMNGQVETVAFSPDGKMFAAATVNGATNGDGVRVWDALTGEELFQLFKGEGGIRSLAFSGDSKTLAVTRPDGIAVISLGPDRNVRRLPVGAGVGRALAFAPTGKYIAATGTSAGGDALIAVGDPWSATFPLVLEKEHKGAVDAVAFSPDGRWLATGGHDGLVKLWVPGEDRFSRKTMKVGGQVHALAFSPDSQVLAIARDNEVQFWDPNSGTLLIGPIISREKGTYQSVAFSPDGRWVIVGGEGGQVILFDRVLKQPVQSITGHQDTVGGAAFSPDSAVLATGSLDRTVRLWRTRSKKSQ